MQTDAFVASVESVIKKQGLKLVYSKSFAPKPPGFALKVDELPVAERFKSALKSKGLSNIYDFQLEAFQKITHLKNTVIVSGTGTGKTEAWLLPILTLLGEQDRFGCIVVYPTKALSRDQLERIKSLSEAVNLSVETYDGDTPQQLREQVYSDPPNILLTNPDMLNLTSRNPRFKRFLRETKFLVLDDFHVYQGIFGANVAHILWRIKRLVQSEVVFVGSSATTANPQIFGKKLFGVVPELVVSNSSVAEQLHLLVEIGQRSKRSAAARLLEELVNMGRRPILFVDSHFNAELIYRGLVGRLGMKVALHRAGLSRSHRERVESGLRNGNICCVVSTPSLELGVDIGGLDTVIMYGVSSSLTRYIQRAGRAGRRGQRSLVIQLLGSDPISQYYSLNPTEYIERPLDPLFMDPENSEVMSYHLLAASIEKPVSILELSDTYRPILRTLVAQGLIKGFGGYYKCTTAGYRYLSEREGIRGSSEAVKIRDEKGNIIGQRSLPIAITELHPNAIYSQAGTIYSVKKLDLTKKLALVTEIESNLLYTKSINSMTPRSFKSGISTAVGGIKLEHGEVEMNIAVTGYLVKDLDDRLLAERSLDEKIVYTFRTKAIKFTLPQKKEWDLMDNGEGFHALEHSVISAGSITMGASETDMGGVSTPYGEIYIYDGQAGGTGATRELLDRFAETLRVAYTILSKCNCQNGCPKCVYSVYCGNNNKFLSRSRACILLNEWIQRIRADQVDN
jgi:DEAD/DEAH box helicase domain-containing protein